MKSKLLSLLVVCLLVSGVGFAQSTPFLQAGVKVGTNIYKVDGKRFKDEFRFGYLLGAFAQVKLGEKWQVQPEVLLFQSNLKMDTTLNAILEGDNLKNVSLNYLAIPILLNYSPTKFFTIQAGPQFGILIDKNQNAVTNGKNAFKNGDFSMLGGVQLNIMNLRIGGRYVVGLNDINDINDQERWTGQGFQVFLGLRII
jgi:hypothetical protein